MSYYRRYDFGFSGHLRKFSASIKLWCHLMFWYKWIRICLHTSKIISANVYLLRWIIYANEWVEWNHPHQWARIYCMEALQYQEQYCNLDNWSDHASPIQIYLSSTWSKLFSRSPPRSGWSRTDDPWNGVIIITIVKGKWSNITETGNNSAPGLQSNMVFCYINTIQDQLTIILAHIKCM